MEPASEHAIPGRLGAVSGRAKLLPSGRYACVKGAQGQASCWQCHVMLMTHSFCTLFNQSPGLFFVFFFPGPLRAYGSSQTRGRIGAAAATLCHTRAAPDLSCTCDLCCSLQQCWILYPLSKAMDRAHILTETMSGP